MLNGMTVLRFENMPELARSGGKKTAQCTHCAVVSKGPNTMGDNPAFNANAGKDMQLRGGSANCNLPLFCISVTCNYPLCI